MSPAPRAPAASQYAATGEAGSFSSSRGAARHLRLAIHRARPPFEQTIAPARSGRRPRRGLIDDAREELGGCAEGSFEEERLRESDDELVTLPHGERGRLDRPERRTRGDQISIRTLAAESLEPGPAFDELRGGHEMRLRDLRGGRDRAGVVTRVVELSGRGQRIASRFRRSRRGREIDHHRGCGAPPPHAPFLPHLRRWYHGWRAIIPFDGGSNHRPAGRTPDLSPQHRS
jgi:hypothetical protein